MQQKVPVIAGPTASGKTAVAVELARQIGGEIISADSMQVYKHLSIGTAKPTPEELAAVTYHLIDHVEPDDQYHLGRFVEEAGTLVGKICDRGKVPIICGGTGMYIRGLLYGIYDGGEPDPVIREQLRKRAQREGLASLHEELKAVDPVSGARYKPTDPQRIIRALEVFQKTGKPLSEFQTQDPDHPVIPSTLFVLKWQRERLYDRINSRVDSMIKSGLFQEVQYYLDRGFALDNPAIKALGYREIISAMHGDMPIDEAVEIMKKKSRNYAKRQETWFRGMPGAVWIDAENRTAAEISRDILAAWEKLQR